MHGPDSPSAWVTRWVTRVPPGGRVLEVASGRGRNARWIAARGYRVDAIDRDPEAVSALAVVPGVSAHRADIENGPWPAPAGVYGGVVVTNYLHRPLFPSLLDALAPGGLLIYETFAAGNERFGRPTNPAFLLKPGELLEAVRGHLRVLAYEDLEVEIPKPAMVQRICATKPEAGSTLG